MAYRRKTLNRESPSLFSGHSYNDDTSVYEGVPLTIGGNSGPRTRYYQYDGNGNILLSESFDPVDSWWGLKYKGYWDPQVFVGRSRAIYNVFILVKRLSASKVWVLIEGESGTGKELVASAISSVKGGPFQPVNCGFPEDGVSFEDTLFGRIDKVINGAIGMEGAFQLANGGVIFLDNIDCITLNQQGKLLRVLQSRPQNVYKMGSSKGETVDVRVICATNKDLLSLIRNGEFRDDFYYRINCVQVNIPPLRDRVEDILLLVVYFLLKYRSDFDRKIKVVSYETIKKLCAYHWPGNVRELEQIIKKVLAIGDGPVLLPEELNFNPPSHITSIPYPQQLSYNSLSNSNQDRLEDSYKICELLQQNPGATARELARFKGCTDRTIERHLKPLLEGEIVKSEEDEMDARKNRYYLMG